MPTTCARKLLVGTDVRDDLVTTVHGERDPHYRALEHEVGNGALHPDETVGRRLHQLGGHVQRLCP